MHASGEDMVELDLLTKQVETHWQGWRELLQPDQLSKLDAQPDFIAELKRVWEASDYVVQSCMRDPGMLLGLLDSGELHSSYAQGEIQQRLQKALVQVADQETLQQALRRFRRYQMVRIIWRDLSGAALLDETMEDLSALADGCVEHALELLYGWALEQHGIPRGEDGSRQSLLVLGMGKLGARELNLSSDIDLIFAFPQHGEVEGSRFQTNEQFFIRLCQQLIKALNSQTEDGFVFRVDARLRPFGKSGPLAMSLDAMEEYYQSQAREWERYAMVKARVVAGEQEFRGELMQMLRPFVYRRYLDFGSIESLRNMKQMISQELKRKGMADNIKLGPGGIREIEFIGQAFQLVRGGRDPELQIRPILPVLELLGQKKLLPEYAVTELTEAYRFLRLVENRLQAWQDQQTHLLPEDEVGRLRLARSMGYAGWNEFYTKLEQHRQRVQSHFDQVFAAPQVESEPAEESALVAVWRGNLAAEESLQRLAECSFPDAQNALQQLEEFRNSHACRSMEARGQQWLEQLMPLLLEAVGGCGEPGVTLERVLTILEAIARRAAYLALLVERPIALSQLVRLSCVSPWIATRLAKYPMLLDELLDPRQLYSPLHREELEEELTILLATIDADDLEQQMERLRQFNRSSKLRVAAADITEVIPLMVVSDYLTEIAEVITAQVLQLSWGHLVARHGIPGGLSSDDTGFAVIAYGKLGGIELGYGSDLDLVFLHSSEDGNAVSSGEQPIANNLFYVRLGQRMIHMFTTRTPSGHLYEIDMRLRPSGNSGMLAASLGAFAEYQREQAWTWEHQALLRARPIAGDPLVIARFRHIRLKVLSQERDPEKLRSDVREMREKMRQSLDRSKGEMFDLKQGVGGITDIEFMVQYLVLREASRYPGLLAWSDNIRLLDGLAEHGVLTAETAGMLADAYRKFRAVNHRNVLRDESGLVAADELPQERTAVRELWQSMMVDGA
jgi:glutamate-ammonia-ligase adenylyltransferase